AMLMPFFAQRAAENLISQKAILVEAERLGLRVNDQELSDELQHGRYAQAFFPGGSFIGQEAYEARIQQAELTVPQFEQSVKEEILFDKLRNLVTGSASVTDAEVHQEFVRKNTKVKFDYAVLRKDDVLKEIHPSEAELKAFYERNKATYNNSIPEKRKIRYVSWIPRKSRPKRRSRTRSYKPTTVSTVTSTAFRNRSRQARSLSRLLCRARMAKLILRESKKRVRKLKTS